MKHAGVVRRNWHVPGFFSTLLVLGAIAGMGLLGPLLHHRANLKARDWPAARGEVVRFEQGVHDGIRGKSCEIRLRYRYSVGGREYFSRRLWFGPAPGCVDPHVPELRAGQQVPVAYDPERPRQSVLARSHPLHLGDYILAAICVLPAVALLAFGLLKQRQRQEDTAAEPGAAADAGVRDGTA